MMRILALGVLSLGLSSTAAADCTVLTGAQVYQDGVPEEGITVVLDEGVIVGVGKGLRSLKLTLNEDESVASAVWGGRSCDYVSINGQYLLPGFVEAYSQIGLVEVELEAETRNDSGGSDPVRAGLVVADAYNPRSTLINIQRSEGVTSAVIAPVGGLFSGVGGWVDLAGDTQSEAVVHREVAQFASIKDGPSRADTLLRLRETLEDAQDFRRNHPAFDRNQRRGYAEGASRIDLAALGNVLNRRNPLVVRANRAADIEGLLRLKKEFNINMIVLGGAEAWMLAAELASAKVGVILDPYVYGPGGFDEVYARPDNAKLLDEAGVIIALSTYSSHNLRNLRQIAGNAVRGGLEHSAAIKAITSNIPVLYGRGNSSGIAVGSVANLVVWSADPLEFSSNVEQVYVGGVSVSLENRQTLLRDRYRSLPVARESGLSISE